MHLINEAIASNDSESTVPSPSTSGVSDSIEKEVDIPKTKHQSTQVNLKKLVNIRSKGTNTNVQMSSVGCQMYTTGVNIGTNTSPQKSESAANPLDDDFDTDSRDFDPSDEDEDSDDNFPR